MGGGQKQSRMKGGRVRRTEERKEEGNKVRRDGCGEAGREAGRESGKEARRAGGRRRGREERTDRRINRRTDIPLLLGTQGPQSYDY